MKLFDDLFNKFLGFQPREKTDLKQNPQEDKQSKPSRGPIKMGPPPYYQGERGTNPPSKPASRPPSPIASRRPSAITPSARTPSARTSSAPTLPTPSPKTSHQPPARTPSATESHQPSARTSSPTESHQPSARTPSATSSRRRSVSPPSKIASPRKKGIFEVTEQYIRSKNKKIHETPTIGEINKEFYDLVQTMRDLKKIEEIIARYKKEGEDNKLFGIELPPEITYDGYEIKKEDLKNESRYFYITKGKLEPLYQLLNDNGITEFNLRERRDSYGKATMKEEENNMRNKKNGLSKNSGGGRGP